MTRPWTEQEKQTLIKRYPLNGTPNGKAEIRAICAATGRTKPALRKKAMAMGLTQRKGTKVLRPWAEEEKKIINAVAGSIPLSLVIQKLHSYWKAEGLPPRSRNSVASAISYLGKPVTVDYYQGDWFTVAVIAEGLRCSNSLVRQWIRDKELNKILKAAPNGETESPYIIKRQNLKKFFIAYPGLLDSTRPNMNWLISILVEK